MKYKEIFNKWLGKKPEIVRVLAKKFPPGKYTIKKDAPYTFTKPDIEVELYAWLETGDVGIIIEAKNKSLDALEHEKMLGLKYHITEEKMEIIHKSAIRAHVDPKWLELKINELD